MGLGVQQLVLMLGIVLFIDLVIFFYFSTESEFERVHKDIRVSKFLKSIKNFGDFFYRNFYILREKKNKYLRLTWSNKIDF